MKDDTPQPAQPEEQLRPEIEGWAGKTQLWEALLKARNDLPVLQKDKANPFLSSRENKRVAYLDINTILAVVSPILHKYGLLVLQPVHETDGQRVVVESRIIHAATGEYVSSLITLPLDKPNAQGVGSAVTYGRRYTLQSLLALEAEDDDGNKASRPPPQPLRREDEPDPFSAEGKSQNGRMAWEMQLEGAQTEKELDAIAIQVRDQHVIGMLSREDFNALKAFGAKRREILTKTGKRK